MCQAVLHLAVTLLPAGQLAFPVSTCSAEGSLPMPVTEYICRLPPIDLQGAGATLKPGRSCITLAYP